MSWLYLTIAGLLEICFATFLRLSANFSKPWPTLGFIISSALSFIFMGMSLKEIPIGTAYAVWTGIGAFGVALLGIFFFDDPIDFWRIFFLSLLVGSIIGLKVVSN
jgi:quaternary ammonium compound-resistance protein SugE